MTVILRVKPALILEVVPVVKPIGLKMEATVSLVNPNMELIVVPVINSNVLPVK